MMGLEGYPVGNKVRRQGERRLPQAQVRQQAGTIPLELRPMGHRAPHPEIRISRRAAGKVMVHRVRGRRSYDNGNGTKSS